MDYRDLDYLKTLNELSEELIESYNVDNIKAIMKKI